MDIITIKNYNFIYPDGHIGLKNINLKIKKNDKMGIIGNNGSGKSTLFLNLMGILFGKGEIKVFQHLVIKKNLKKIRQKMNIVFQDVESQLFNTTVYEDVAFGPVNLNLSKDKIIIRVNDALKKVNMLGFENRNPYNLSLGEKKKIAIASILSMNPEIILFDEPLSSLDPKSRREIKTLLGNLNTAMLIISHNIEFVKSFCNKVIIMKNGEIVENCKPVTILNDSKLLEKYQLI